MAELIQASCEGILEKVIECLRGGSDVHARDDEALWDASFHGHVEVVKILLEAGADVHARNDRALWMASCKGHAEVVKLLLDYGADKDGLHPEATPKMREYIPVNQRRVCL